MSRDAEHNTSKEKFFVDMANKLFVHLDLPFRITTLDEITASHFLALYEGIIGEQVSGSIESPDCSSDDLYNLQIVINNLSSEVLHLSLSHIRARDILAGDRAAIRDLIELFDGLMEYLLEASSQATATLEEFESPLTDGARKEGSDKLVSCLSPPVRDDESETERLGRMRENGTLDLEEYRRVFDGSQQRRTDHSVDLDVSTITEDIPDTPLVFAAMGEKLRYHVGRVQREAKTVDRLVHSLEETTNQSAREKAARDAYLRNLLEDYLSTKTPTFPRIEERLTTMRNNNSEMPFSDREKPESVGNVTDFDRSLVSNQDDSGPPPILKKSTIIRTAAPNNHPLDLIKGGIRARSLKSASYNEPQIVEDRHKSSQQKRHPQSIGATFSGGRSHPIQNRPESSSKTRTIPVAIVDEIADELDALSLPHKKRSANSSVRTFSGLNLNGRVPTGSQRNYSAGSDRPSDQIQRSKKSLSSELGDHFVKPAPIGRHKQPIRKKPAATTAAERSQSLRDSYDERMSNQLRAVRDYEKREIERDMEKKVYERLLNEALLRKNRDSLNRTSFEDEHLSDLNKFGEILESQSSHYQDQYRSLSESNRRERKELADRDRENSRAFQRMKHEHRRAQENQIRDLQEDVVGDHGETMFRRLDAERVMRDMADTGRELDRLHRATRASLRH